MYAIAIDGPAAAGKTTTAKLLAKCLTESMCDIGVFHYVDTGALYRVIALDMLRRKKRIEDIDEVLADIDIRVELCDNGDQLVYLSDENVTGLLRTDEISMLASDISALAQVRAFLLKQQRDLAKEYNVVMEGRDIGSTILPNANVKFYLTATVTQRAIRRANESGTKNICLYVDELNKRDNNDRTRAESPLVCVDDAVVIDSTPMSVEQVVNCMHDTVLYKLNEEITMRAMTADGAQTGIGRKVYAIWPKLRLSKNGRIIKSKELDVVQATVSAVTFALDMNNDANWYGTACTEIAYISDNGTPKTLYTNIPIGPYNAFFSEENANEHISDFASGMEEYPGEAPIPHDALCEKIGKFRNRFKNEKED